MIDLKIPEYIDQARRMNASEMEPLFWKVEDSIASGNIQQAKGCYALLAYAALYNKSAIEKGLQPAYRDRLRTLTFEIFGSHTTKTLQSVTMRPAINPVPLPFEKERDLQNFLVDHKEVLSKALNDDIRIVGTEVEIDKGYRCDIAAEGVKLFYPIELKIVQATHQVVSQANKYVHLFFRRLRYNFYRPIQGVVICNGADSWSINELRREGLWVFTIHAESKDKVRLDRIT